jgi:hypothetical protein
MMRQRCLGVVSFVAGLSLFGLGSARAQDAQGGYPPPPADPNAPPPGAYAAPPPQSQPGAYPPGAYPPGAYPPGAYPPGAYPQPAPMPPPPPPRSPFLALGFLGFHSIQNSNSGTGPGLRVGGIGGFRLSDQLSLNGEIVYDLVNYDGPATGVTEYNVQVAAAPFFHAPVGPTADVLVGPKVGFFRYGFSEDAGYGYSSFDYGYNGLILGVNAGAFFRVSPMLAIGGLLSFDWEKVSSCSGGYGYGAYYTSCSSNESIKLVSAGGGILF